MMPSLLEILFVGHSLIGTTMPVMLQDVILARHDGGRVSAQIINGATLGWNWEHSSSAQGVDGRQVLSSGETDVLVITEAVPLRNHTQWSNSNERAYVYYDLAISSNPETRIYLFETWHSLNSGTGVAVEYDEHDHIPWRTRLDLDLSGWEAIADYVNSQRGPGAPEMNIIPGGQAMARLSDAIGDDTVPGLDDVSEVFADDIHPNDIGNYFVAMVQYATIYRESPVGLPSDLTDQWGRSYSGLTAGLAARLQEIAWETVTSYPRSGVADAEVKRTAVEAPGDVPMPSVEASLSAPRHEVKSTPDDRRIEPSGLLENPPLGVGLAGVVDWSSQQPFIDIMKTGRPWIGHLPGKWGGWGHDDLAQHGYLDEQGWVKAIPPELSSVATIVLSGVADEALPTTGRYRLTYKGRGRIAIDGAGPAVEYLPGEIWFSTNSGSDHVILTIMDTDPQRTGDYIRDIEIVSESNIALHEAGITFNPDWLSLVSDFRLVRLMDWMATNDSTQQTWDARPKPGDYTYARNGVPLEVMLQLVNEIGADPWFNIPHLADDDYIRRFATLVKSDLSPSLKAHVEYSNEVWNWQFEQARWAEAKGAERWAQNHKWVEFYALRASQVAMIWDDVFGVEANTRLVKVIATQSGWLGLEEAILNAPAWAAEKLDGFIPPYRHFDAYAVTGYFSARLGEQIKAPMVKQWIADSLKAAESDAEAMALSGKARDDFIAAHRYDLAVSFAASELRNGGVSGDRENSIEDLLQRVLPYQMGVARQHDLDLIMYEGGSHVVGIGPVVDDAEITEFLIHLNYTSQMGELYGELMEGWKQLGGTLFNVFVDVSMPTKWGSWGALRHLGDSNARWNAVMMFNNDNDAWWETRASGTFLGQPAKYSDHDVNQGTLQR